MALPRLLLIDDEPALAAFVAKAADMCGFEPVIAEQDQAFRDSFRESRPKMVALDLGMPETPRARSHGGAPGTTSGKGLGRVGSVRTKSGRPSGRRRRAP